MLPVQSFIKCPSCGAMQVEISNPRDLFSQPSYSDGCYNKVFCEYSSQYFVKCSVCGVFFKDDESVHSSRDEIPEGGDCMWIKRLSSAKDFFQAIKEGLHNTGPKGSHEWKQDVLQLRIDLWRGFNELFAYALCWPEEAKFNETHVKKVYIDNCRKIISMFNGDSDERCLLKAELYRNIGEFDICGNWLKKTARSGEYWSGKYWYFRTAIKSACDKKVTATFRGDFDIPFFNATELL